MPVERVEHVLHAIDSKSRDYDNRGQSFVLFDFAVVECQVGKPQGHNVHADEKDIAADSRKTLGNGEG